MAPRFAWILNLDADLELGGDGRYRLSKRVRLAMKAPIRLLARSLLGPHDVLVDESCRVGIARGLRGRAFCPTPRAIAILERAGADPEPHPAVDVLRCVNSRAFASALGATLPGATFATDLEVARTMLCAAPMVGKGWRVKHAFGMAGRNQRVVAPSAIDERTLAFVQAGLAQGGVQIEPNVVIDTEYAVHGLIAQDGSLRVGALVRQRCDPRGAWLATESTSREREGNGEVGDRMAEESRCVAGALLRAGYFGPFGVDAYTYRDREGGLRLQPRSEINARYSMGFAMGWGGPPAGLGARVSFEPW